MVKRATTVPDWQTRKRSDQSVYNQAVTRENRDLARDFRDMSARKLTVSWEETANAQTHRVQLIGPGGFRYWAQVESSETVEVLSSTGDLRKRGNPGGIAAPKRRTGLLRKALQPDLSRAPSSWGELETVARDLRLGGATRHDRSAEHARSAEERPIQHRDPDPGVVKKPPIDSSRKVWGVPHKQLNMKPADPPSASDVKLAGEKLYGPIPDQPTVKPAQVSERVRARLEYLRSVGEL